MSSSDKVSASSEENFGKVLKINEEEIKSQLALIYPILRRAENALLVGDFNFCSSWDDEEESIEPDFRDLWPLLRGDDPGYTQDTDVNVMRRHVEREIKQVRFDCILYRGSGAAWRPISICHRSLENRPVMVESKPAI